MANLGRQGLARCAASPKAGISRTLHRIIAVYTPREGPSVKRIGTMLMSVAAASVLLTGTANASAGSASQAGQAGALGGCLVKICGSVMNESNHRIWAIRDFDANGPKPGTEWRILNPGDQTPPTEDWDGLYVECNATGRIAWWAPPGVWIWSNFSLSAGWWRKVSTDEDAHVRGQSC